MSALMEQINGLMTNPLEQYPKPPYNAVMPADWQLVFTIITGLLALTAWAYAIYLSFKERDVLPLIIMIGGTFCVFVEPALDVLGSVWFPIHGQWRYIETFGRPMPVFVGMLYMVYFGGMVLITVRKFEKGLAIKQVWRWYLIMCIIEFSFEPIPINLGLWMYYGNQPFTFVGFPLYWPVVNAACAFAVSALIVKTRPYLKGPYLIAIIPMMVSGDFMTYGATLWPLWNALHTTQGYLITTAAGFLTLGLSGMAIQLIARIVAKASPLPHAKE